LGRANNKMKIIEPSYEPIFKVGTIVQLTVENDNDFYSYELPVQGSIGTVEEETYQLGFYSLFGIKVPMSIIKWENGAKTAVYNLDLRELKN
jgi:hypothetical protein